MMVEQTPRDYFGPNAMEKLDSSPSFLPDSLPSAKSKRCKRKNGLFPVPDLQACSSKAVTSPTMSLAADLSQNFHIDKTPVAPTPRRSLFASFQQQQQPSSSSSSTLASAASSPSSDTDVDSDSPLPHKLRPKQVRISSESAATPRHKPSLSSASSFLCQDKRLAPPERPTKFRRTQSMYQHPQDVVMENTEESCPLGIKSFATNEDSFRRIERGTLCDILDGHYNHIYDRCILIDCRFEYEYKGGHIDGAVNINTKDELERQVLQYSDSSKKTLLVFHCEYSAHRGPRMAQHLRSFDRQLNAHRYPELYYPDVVVLQGGYSRFFDQHYDRCVPQRYVEMNDSSYKQTCEREMTKFRRNMKVMCASRSQSYTYGNASSSCSPINFRFPSRKEDELVGQRLFV